MVSESEARRQRAATLDESLIHMEQKITSLISVTQKVKDRATMQVAALFNIIAQNDAKDRRSLMSSRSREQNGPANQHRHRQSLPCHCSGEQARQLVHENHCGSH